MLIYAPSSLSVPDMEGSTSDSIELSQDLAPSVTWKTKFLRPQSWLTILKKADWMTRLFGPISRRLILARSGAELMQSWADTLASRSPSQDSGEEQKTPGTCGHTSQESLTLFGPESASLRTSVATFDWDCQKCLENSDGLATELGRAYSQRRKSAPRTEGSESLSWPTARAGDGKHGGPNQRDGSGSAHLSSAAQETWSTPRASPNENRTTKPPPSHGKTHGRCLAGDVHLWPTASARDYKDTPGMAQEAKNPDGSRRDRTDQLARAVYSWPTPRATSEEAGRRRDNPMLSTVVQDYPGQVAQENHNTPGKSREQSTENSIHPGLPS
jgi:hypothetical protein